MMQKQQDLVYSPFNKMLESTLHLQTNQSLLSCSQINNENHSIRYIPTSEITKDNHHKDKKKTNDSNSYLSILLKQQESSENQKLQEIEQNLEYLNTKNLNTEESEKVHDLVQQYNSLEYGTINSSEKQYIQQLEQNFKYPKKFEKRIQNQNHHGNPEKSTTKEKLELLLDISQHLTTKKKQLCYHIQQSNCQSQKRKSDQDTFDYTRESNQNYQQEHSNNKQRILKQRIKQQNKLISQIKSNYEEKLNQKDTVIAKLQKENHSLNTKSQLLEQIHQITIDIKDKLNEKDEIIKKLTKDNNSLNLKNNYLQEFLNLKDTIIAQLKSQPNMSVSEFDKNSEKMVCMNWQKRMYPKTDLLGTIKEQKNEIMAYQEEIINLQCELQTTKEQNSKLKNNVFQINRQLRMAQKSNKQYQKTMKKFEKNTEKYKKSLMENSKLNAYQLRKLLLEQESTKNKNVSYFLKKCKNNTSFKRSQSASNKNHFQENKENQHPNTKYFSSMKGVQGKRNRKNRLKKRVKSYFYEN